LRLVHLLINWSRFVFNFYTNRNVSFCNLAIEVSETMWALNICIQGWSCLDINITSQRPSYFILNWWFSSRWSFRSTFLYIFTNWNFWFDFLNALQRFFDLFNEANDSLVSLWWSKSKIILSLVILIILTHFLSFS
jgi:hypothetical protein